MSLDSAALGLGGNRERAGARAASVSAGDGLVGGGVVAGGGWWGGGGGGVVWSGGAVGEAGRALRGSLRSSGQAVGTSPASTGAVGAGVARDGVGCLGFGGWRYLWLELTELEMASRQASVLKALMYSCWAWRVDCIRVWSM